MTSSQATVLLDLDDTLLNNDLDVFLPAYLSSIEIWLKKAIPSDGFMRDFMRASQAMQRNGRPDRTLSETFFSHFLAGLEVGQDDLQPILDRFYEEAYPRLRVHTSPAPDGGEVVRYLRDKGHRVVIATNPLFPAAAIHQRVDWADLGLPVEAFDLVTTFERFHFAKPDPAYYAEILAYLGWPEGPAVMVGDDSVRDIQASTKLGLATYYIFPDRETRAAAASSSRHGAGALTDFPAWLEETPESALIPVFDTADGILAVLKSTISALDLLVRECESAAWSIRPEGG